MDLNKNINYIQFIIYISLLILGVGIAWSKIDTKVNRIDSMYTPDHDMIIRCSTKIDNIEAAVSEIKNDVREIRNSYRNKSTTRNQDLLTSFFQWFGKL